MHKILDRHRYPFVISSLFAKCSLYRADTSACWPDVVTRVNIVISPGQYWHRAAAGDRWQNMSNCNTKVDIQKRFLSLVPILILSRFRERIFTRFLDKVGYKIRRHLMSLETRINDEHGRRQMSRLSFRCSGFEGWKTKPNLEETQSTALITLATDI